MSITISDFYSGSVKGQIGQENWKRISEGKTDPEILAIARLCAVATGKETINDAREEQALIARATRGLKKLGLGTNLPNSDTLTTEGQPTSTPDSTPTTTSHNPEVTSTDVQNLPTEAEQPQTTETTLHVNGEASEPAHAPTTSNTEEDPIEALSKRINALAVEAASATTTEERRTKIQKEIQDLTAIKTNLLNQAKRDDRETQQSENSETNAEQRAHEAEQRASAAEKRAVDAETALDEADRRRDSLEATGPVRTQTEFTKAETDLAVQQGRLNEARQRNRNRQRQEIRSLNRDLSRLVGL